MNPTPIFWLIAMALVLATVAALVWPLLRSRDIRPPDDDGAMTDVYRDQKRQLDAELAAGAITGAERDAQLDELAGRLGAELAATPTFATSTSPRARFVAALALVAAVPASAILLYAVFSTSGPPPAAPGQANDPSAPPHDEIVAMVAKLAARMKEHPEDPAGWRLLARAYASLGRFSESTAAFGEAAAHAPPDASLLADWADALAMQNQSLQGEPSTLIARALALDPKYPKALSLSATAALERHDYAGAIAEWRKLKAEFPPDSEQAREIDAMIAEADGASRGVPTAAAGSSVAGANATPVMAPAATPAGPPPADVQATAITGRISIDRKLQGAAAPGDALFIFARPVNGSRMPLAVVRATAGELPRDFRLDDTMAMSPTARLSGAAQVLVEARISKSGTATPSAGDLRGASAPVKPGTHGVSIVINDTVR